MDDIFVFETTRNQALAVCEGDLPLPYEVYGKPLWYLKEWCMEKLMHIGILRMHIPEDHLTKEVYEGDLLLPYEVYGKPLWYLKEWCREKLKHIPEDHGASNFSDNHLIQLKRLDRNERSLEVKPICAKEKRVPIKGTTTPQMASRLGWYLKTVFKEDENVYYGNDSQCVWKWRQHHERGYISFVRSKITEVPDKIGGILRKHYQTGDNPADLPTRELTVDQFKTAATWWNGPHWLLDEQVGNPTSTTSHLKRRETKDAQGSAHFFYEWVFKFTFKLIIKIGI
jgi:hypothetical protein